MSKVFITSDHHLGQSATFEKFKLKDGSPLRPFKSLDEMHHTIITKHNSVVSDGDLVIFLGDVAFSGRAYDEIMPQLNGDKRLVRGNHDRFSESRYRRHFNRILGCYIRDRYVFTHVPIHPDCLSRWVANIHGHLHGNLIMDGDIPDKRYVNVSVEQINYTPIDFEEIKKLHVHRELSATYGGSDSAKQPAEG